MRETIRENLIAVIFAIALILAMIGGTYFYVQYDSSIPTLDKTITKGIKTGALPSQTPVEQPPAPLPQTLLRSQALKE